MARAGNRTRAEDSHLSKFVLRSAGMSQPWPRLTLTVDSTWLVGEIVYTTSFLGVAVLGARPTEPVKCRVMQLRSLVYVVIILHDIYEILLVHILEVGSKHTNFE